MDGIILIDKPSGYTSRDIVNIVGKSLNTKKVGHTGTLDPLATGVLVVAVNDGLKVVPLLNNDTKQYIAEVQVGILTDTLDITGNVVKEDPHFKLKKEEIEEVLHSFLGFSMQEVPLYSAVKVNGKKLYQYARNKEQVTLPKKEIQLLDIALLEVKEDTFQFVTTVSKGTYIRSLVRDIGEKLNILCTMKGLRRTKVGVFGTEKINSIEDIKNINIKWISMKEALSNYKMVYVDEVQKQQILNGLILKREYEDDIIVFLDKEDRVVAIYGEYPKDHTKIKPIKVFSK